VPLATLSDRAFSVAAPPQLPPLIHDERVTDTPAWDAWSSLTEAERNEVGRLAKRGKRHPDARVAAAAAGWANVILSKPEALRAERRTLPGRLFAALLLVVELFLSNSWDMDYARARDERRWARRVMAAR
jgi:hypothetical protein